MSELEKKFEVLKVLGQGSFGRVYLCRFLSSSKRKDLVAVKRIQCDDVEDVNNFLKEIVEIRDLDHPNLVKYFEGFIDQCESKFYVNIVMEYLPGFQVCEILKYYDSLQKQNPETDVVVNEFFIMHILVSMVEALMSIHSKQIIHRDISTNNIMVIIRPKSSKSEKLTEMKENVNNENTPKSPILKYTIPQLTNLPSSELTFKLLDFGFVTRKISENSLIDSFDKGTPDFLSPEFLIRQPYNESVDIFSLGGVLLNFLLAKQCHVYATIVSEGKGKLFEKLEKKGYSQKFLKLVFSMLEISPDKRISTKQLFHEIEELKNDLIEHEKVSKLQNLKVLKDQEKKRRESERKQNVFEKSTIVSVTKSLNLTFWDWKNAKFFGVIPSAHIWSITGIVSLSPGCYFSNPSTSSSDTEYTKYVLVSGGSKIKLIKLSGKLIKDNISISLEAKKDISNSSPSTPKYGIKMNLKSQFSSDFNHTSKKQSKFYEFSKTFKSSSQIEVICPIFKNKEDKFTHFFGSGGSKIIEIWDIRNTNMNTNDEKNMNVNISSNLVLEGHQDSVVTLCSFKSGLKLGSGSKDRTCRIFDLEKSVCEFMKKDSKFINCVDFNESLNLFSFSNSWGMEIHFFDYRMDMNSKANEISVFLDFYKKYQLSSIAMTQHITSYQIFNDYYLIIGDNLRLSCFDLRKLREEQGGKRKIMKLWMKKENCNDLMDLVNDHDLFAFCDRSGQIRVKNIIDGKTIVKLDEVMVMDWKTSICCL